MTKGIREIYRALVADGRLQPDPAQADIVEHLDDLADRLTRRSTGSSWTSIFGRSILFGKEPETAPGGLYICGKVGRGKTLLMDLFFEHVPFKHKTRMHFHRFMANAHDAIAEARQTHGNDPIDDVARQIAQATTLICLDELQVNDIVDAMIVGRLFDALFAQGVVLVATSNHAPQDLYRDGLNRALFEPFIDLIQRHMQVLELTAAKDFRLEKLSGQPLYFTPADEAACREMDRLWASLSGGVDDGPVQLDIKGRILTVPRAAMGAARFTFDDLCVRPLGALDYLSLAQSFHTLMIDNIPVLGPDRRNEARRFINLIDTLYDHRLSLIVSADGEPDELYVAGDGADQFQRTASRLIEMRSAEYLKAREQRAAAMA